VKKRGTEPFGSSASHGGSKSSLWLEAMSAFPVGVGPWFALIVFNALRMLGFTLAIAPLTFGFFVG